MTCKVLLHSLGVRLVAATFAAFPFLFSHFCLSCFNCATSFFFCFSSMFLRFSALVSTRQLVFGLTEGRDVRGEGHLSMCWIVLRGLANTATFALSWPFLTGVCMSLEMRMDHLQWLQDEGGTFSSTSDIAHYSQSWMFPFGSGCKNNPFLPR